MIPTGITKLDDFLNGGIHSGIIVDIFGSSATGKTQLALQILVNCISKNQNVLFHDTKGEFRPERIIDILKSKQLPDKLLDNIDVKRITNTAEQIESLNEKFNREYSLLIIDNVTELFSYEYSDDSQQLTKNILFMKYLQNLSLIASQKNIPVIITNMIRNQNEDEVEYMVKATEPFTHIKIHLTKNYNKFTGKVQFLLNKSSFEYTIEQQGIIESN